MSDGPQEGKADRSDPVGRGEAAHPAVPPGCECPKCNEPCPGLLIWIDEEGKIVGCQTCGTKYRPATGGRHDDA